VSKRLFLPVIMVCTGLMWHPDFARAATHLQIRLAPNVILMGATYNGTTLLVSGAIPKDAEAFVRVTGELEDVKLKKKGRALGLLWMNMGSVNIRQAPNVFLLCPSKALEEISQTNQENWRRLGLGFEGLKGRVGVTPASEDKDALFKEFVKLKEIKELYAVYENAIAYGSTSGSMKPFTATVGIPSDMPQGVFKIEVFAIRDDAVLAAGTQEMKVAEVGLPAMMSSMAFHHGTLYGIVAVMVAILAGLLTGVVFKGGKGAH
jgi:uncharacterized protein (TIGR02186 family)